jgi:hypothetical protein
LPSATRPPLRCEPYASNYLGWSIWKRVFLLEYSQRIPKPGGLLSGRERNAAITDAKLEVLALVLRVVLARTKGPFIHIND